MTSLAKFALQRGGKIKPLVIPCSFTNGTGLFNPTVFVDEDNILVNIRHCQYSLYHAELNRLEHQWGPLLYLNPDNDMTLTTTNYLCKLNSDLDIRSFFKVDTSNLDVNPLWEFVGLENARLWQMFFFDT